MALDLFTEKGFETASLREIAEQLGLTKAALYYHFASKDDIFIALHLRLEQVLQEGASRFGDEPQTMESWAQRLDWLIEMIPANRKLIAMHERNRAAVEVFHRRDGSCGHQSLDEQLRAAVFDSSIPARDRVRLACALWVVMGGVSVAVGNDAFGGVSSDRLVAELKAAVHDLLGG